MSLYVLLSVHKSLNAHINFIVIIRLSLIYSQYTSHWMPIPSSHSFFVSLHFTLNPQVTECPYQLPGHCSSLYVLHSIHKSLNAHTNFQVIVRLSPFYSQSTSHWMPISTSRSLFVFLRFTLSPPVTECPYQPSSHFLSLYVLLSVHESLNAHINFQVIVRLSTFYSQSTSHWMPISTSQSLFVSLRFTLSQQFTECPYQLPSHCSSFSVLLSVHESLNAHINFQVIVRLSSFYSQSASNGMPISTSRSLFVSLRFTLSPQVTECPYQLPNHCSSLYVLLSVQSHWIPISTSHSLFVSLRFTLIPQVTEYPYQLPTHCSSLYVLLSVHKSLNTHINCQLIVRLSTFYSQSTSHWMPISTSQPLFVSLRFTLNQQVTECPYQLPTHCSSLCVLLSVHKSLNAHINFQVIVRLSPFYSQSTIHWMPISTSMLLFVSLRFTLSPQFTECPYQLPSHCSSFSVLLSVHESLNAHTNFPVIFCLSTFYSQSTCHWMSISTSQSLFVSLVLLSVDNSLNAHINFPVIVRLSTFYSQSTIHWRPISTSRSLVVSQRFTLSPQVTECPYQLPVIVRLSTFYSQSTSHWMSISTSQSLFVSLRFTLSPQVTECPYQLPSHCSSLSVLHSVHKSLNAHINFQVIIRLSTFYSQSTSHWMPKSTSQSLFVSLHFTLNPQVTEYPYQLPTHCSSFYVYSQSTSHWMPISTSQSLFVSLRFTLNKQVTECPYQLPGHCSSLSVLLSVHNSLNAHINFQVIVRLSPFYSQSTIHWMPISTSQSLFVFLCFTLSTRVTECTYQLPSHFSSLRFTLSQHVTECPYQLPSHCSSLYVLLSVHNSLNAHINFPLIVRLSTFYSQSTSHWMPISTSQSLVVSQRFTLSPQVIECPYQFPSHCSSLYVLLSIHKSLNAHINFQVIVRLSTFYSQSTSRWIPISIAQSLFVSLCFTLSTRVTECPYQLPSHFSSLYVLLSVHKSLNAHINFIVIVRLSLIYSQYTSHWMPIPTSYSFFVSLHFTLNPQVTECPYQLPGHCSSLYVLHSIHKSLNAHTNFQVIVRLSPFYSQSTSHWMPISTSRSLFVSLRFILTQ